MSIYFTDTDCEMWYTDVDKLGINIIKMPYTLDGVEYYYDMGRDTDFKKLNQRMREGSTPTTSALNPQDYIDYFEPFFAKGEDILYVHFSDKMSGTFDYMNTALNILKEKYPKRAVRTINTRSISYGAGMQALEAGKLHKEGKSDQEIMEYMDEFSKHISTNFVVDNLAHLKRGGRISATTAIVGGLLNIKPILKVNDDGAIDKVGTGKGMKKALLNIIEEMKGNIDKIDKYPVYVLDADNKDMASWLEEEIKKSIAGVKTERYPIGPVIGAHCGPGTCGVVYYGKHR